MGNVMRKPVFGNVQSGGSQNRPAQLQSLARVFSKQACSAREPSQGLENLVVEA